MARRFPLRGALCLVGLALGAPGGQAAPAAVLRGTVEGAAGPIAGAVVRVPGTAYHCLTDAEGRFVLSGLPAGRSFPVTAWAPGYYVGGGEKSYRPGRAAVLLRLRDLPAADNAEYAWLPVESSAVAGGEDKACENCHSRAGTQLTFDLPVDEWRLDAHGRSLSNPRFLGMYLGQDAEGHRSEATGYATDPDYGRMPLRPASDRPHYGPGYKLDFPGTAGNCAACHAPAAAVRDPFGVDPTTSALSAAGGITCDFCHKVGGVRREPQTGLPQPKMPGVLSFELLRPPAGRQLFAGPRDDVAPGDDTYSPVYRESRFCAPCHFGVFWDTLVYNSFGEWLESPYAEAKSGKTCQDCHMPSVGATHFVRPDKGGRERDTASVVSHRMPGAADEALLRKAVSLALECRWVAGRLEVEVTLRNSGAGHHVPTGSPMRHLILLVSAADHDGSSLRLESGSVLPSWCGEGQEARGHYAGQPGKAYAKVLKEEWTEIAPSAAYWNPTRIVSDNRIPALASDTTRFVFSTAEGLAAEVTATLLFRRAFIDLAERKGWPVDDVVMVRRTMTVERSLPR